MMEFGPGGLGVPPPSPAVPPKQLLPPPIPSCWGAAGRTTWGPRRLGKRGGQSPPIFLDPETCGHCPTTRGGGGGPNMASGGMSVHPPPHLGVPPTPGWCPGTHCWEHPPPPGHILGGPEREFQGVPQEGGFEGAPKGSFRGAPQNKRWFQGGPKREFRGGPQKGVFRGLQKGVWEWDPKKEFPGGPKIGGF